MDGKEKTSEPFLWVEEYANFDWQQQQQQQEQMQYQQANPSTRKRKKMEFVGWGSKPLIHFLESIGSDTTNPISQIDVTAIVNDYVDRNLLQSETTGFNFYNQSVIKAKTAKKKKKRVLCDERLRALFGRKSISRVMIYKLLERHLAEANQLFDSDDSHDYLSCGNDEEEDEAGVGEEANAKHRKTYTKREIAESTTPKSCFAAVIPQNIKLIYLRRSLVREILKAENGGVDFEMKIVGCFVRIKSDPNDCLQKHSHHLLQVSGVKKGSENEGDETKIILHASGVIKDIPIGVLSDEDFSEDEAGKAAEKREGLIYKYFNIACDMFYNAAILDRLDIFGMRILDKEECDDLRQKMKDGILKRLTVEELQHKAHILHEDMTKHWLASELALLQNLIDRANEKGWRRELFEYLERRELLQTQEEQSRLLSELPEIVAEEIEPEDSTPCCPDEVEERNDSPPESIHRRPTDAAPFSDNADDEFELTWAGGYSSEDHEPAVEPQPNGSVQECDKELENSTIERHGICETKNLNEVESKTPQRASEQEVIDLSDDDESEPPMDKVRTSVNLLEEAVWHYLDPQGDAQGPFTMASLKRWSEADYFPPDFRIWKTGHSQSEAVYLKDILSRDFPI